MMTATVPEDGVWSLMKGLSAEKNDLISPSKGFLQPPQWQRQRASTDHRDAVQRVDSRRRPLCLVNAQPRVVRESLTSKSSEEGQEPARERFMRSNAQDVQPGFLRCDLQSVRREVEQVIRLVTIPARASRFPGANIGNGHMQQSPGPEPRACRIEKSHRLRDVFEQMIHHYDVE